MHVVGVHPWSLLAKGMSWPSQREWFWCFTWFYLTYDNFISTNKFQSHSDYVLIFRGGFKFHLHFTDESHWSRLIGESGTVLWEVRKKCLQNGRTVLREKNFSHKTARAILSQNGPSLFLSQNGLTKRYLSLTKRYPTPWICDYVNMWICAYVHMCICAYVYMCSYVYACMSVCIRTY